MDAKHLFKSHFPSLTHHRLINVTLMMFVILLTPLPLPPSPLDTPFPLNLLKGKEAILGHVPMPFLLLLYLTNTLVKMLRIYRCFKSCSKLLLHAHIVCFIPNFVSAFVHRSTYTRHVRKHLGQKLYVCKPCNKNYSQVGSLACFDI